MGVLSYLTGIGSRDMAVDLGTANTLVYVRGRGVVLSEPSTGARDIAELITEVDGNRFAHPRVVVCVPAGAAEAERDELKATCLAAGAGEVHAIAAPMAAAIGAGLPIGQAAGSLIVDIGAGTTEAAVIARGKIVVSRSIGAAGNALDAAITDHCEKAHGLAIDAPTAEELKIQAGSAARLVTEVPTEVRGRDLAGGPKTVTLTSEEVRDALAEPLAQIIAAVGDTLDRTPPELAAGVRERGIMLAGGGSLLQGLKQRLSDEHVMPCQMAQSPLTCVVVGSGLSLEEFEAIHRAENNPNPQNAHVSQTASSP